MTESITCEHCESQLFDFHEGKLKPEVAASVDSHLKDCDECSALLNDIWQMGLMTTRWQDQQAQSWDRQGTFFEKRRWEFPQVFASAASVLALVLVLTDTRIVTTDAGIALEIGQQPYVSETALAEYKVQQEAEIAERFELLTAQQVASNQLLLRSVLETSREERREDFTTLVTYWNAAQAQQQLQTEQDLRYLLASQAEDEKDIQQLSAAFQQIQRGNNM